VISPPLVRRRSDGKNALIFGHRRVGGARATGLKYVGCLVVSDLTDLQASKLVLAENAYRPPNPIEIARYLLAFKDRYSLSQKEVGACAGMTEEALSNLFRVYADEPLRRRVQDGTLKLGPAIEFLTAKSHLAPMSPEQWESFVNKTPLTKTSEIRKLARTRKSEILKHSIVTCLSCGGTDTLEKVHLCSTCKGKIGNN
jgi:hypothetical protein